MRPLFSICILLCFTVWVGSAQLVYQPNASPNGTRIFAGCVVNNQVAWFVYNPDQGPSSFICRTTDGGSNWSYDTIHAASGKYDLGHMVAIDGFTAWVSSGDISGATSGALFKTTDGGETWTHQTSAFPGSGGYLNNVHFFDADNGLCTGDQNGGYFEIYTTSDGGDTWVRVPSEQIPPAIPGYSAWAFSYAYHGECFWFVDTRNRVYRSTDRGYNWSVSAEHSGQYAVIAFEDDQNGLMSLYPNLLYRTTDGGATWADLPAPDWLLDIGNIACVPGAPSTYVSCAWGVSGLDTTAILVFSTDAGTSWKKMDIPYTQAGYWPYFSSRSAGWLTGIDGSGILRWPGYESKHLWACAPSLRLACWDAGTLSSPAKVSIGNYGTEPTTVTGFSLPAGDFTITDLPSTPLVLPPWEAVDVTVTFSPQSSGSFVDSLVILSDAANAPQLGVRLIGNTIRSVYVLPGNSMYAAAEALYEIAPGGAASVVGPLAGGPFHGLAVNAVTRTLYGITTAETSSSLVLIDPHSPGAIPSVTIPVGNMRAIAFSPDGTLFGATKTGALIRIDPGTGDTSLVGTASGIAYASLAFSPSGELYASVQPAIFNRDAIYRVDTTIGSTTLVGKTGDNAITPAIAFSASGELFGLKGTQSQENKIIHIDPSTGAGTDLGMTGVSGLQAITMIDMISTSVAEGPQLGVPGVFELHQNYPNPFNPATTVSFSLPEQTLVVLRIYNMLGQEVTTLLDAELDAGIHTVRFDAEDLASGLYLYRIHAGRFTATKKMMLLR